MSRNIKNGVADYTMYLLDGITDGSNVIAQIPPLTTQYVTFTTTAYIGIPRTYFDTQIKYEFGTTSNNFSITKTAITVKDIDGSNIKLYYTATPSLGGSGTNQFNIYNRYTPTGFIDFNMAHASIYPNKFQAGRNIPYTIEVDEGYKFVGFTDCYYTDSTGNVDISSKFSVSDDKRTITTGTTANSLPSSTTAVVINGTTESTSTVEITPTFSISNATLSPTTVKLESSTTLTITCDSGYILATVNSSYNDTEFDFTISNDRKTATYTGIFPSDTTTITITGTTTTEPKEIPITFEIDNATIYPTSIYSDTTSTITITCDSGYTFSTVSSKYYDSDTGDYNTFTFSLNSGKNIATYTGAFASNVQRLYIEGTTEKTKETGTLSFSIDNATINTTTYVVGETTTLTITCDTDYYLVDLTARYYDKSTGNYVYLTFTNSEDNTSSTWTGIIPSNINTFTITGSTNKGQPVTKIENDLIAIYIPTNEELGEIGNKRFYTISSETYQQYDLGVYITSYRKAYLEKSDLSIIGVNSVSLGNFDLKVYCDTVDSYIVKKSLGTVKVESTNNNTLDNNSQISVNLPFIGFVELPTDKIINHTIEITYTINIISGDCIAYIISDNVVISVNNGNVSYEPPYIFNGTIVNTTARKDYTFNSGFLTDKTATLNVWYNEEIKNYVTDNKIVTLSDLSGFATLENVELNNLALTDNEYDELVTILSEGVYF